MCRKFILISGILIAAVSAQDGAVVNLAALVNCSSSESIISGIQKCLDLYDLPITLPDTELLSNSSTSSAAMALFLKQIDRNTTVNLCRPENRENYISGSVCIYKIMKKCTVDNPVLQSLILSPQKVRQQIEFQCQTIAGFNQDCVVSKIVDIQNCVNFSRSITGIQGDNSTDDQFLSGSVCVTLQLTRFCARKHLESCGATTVQLYEQNLPVLDVCKSYTDSNPGTDDKMEVDCSSDSGVRMSYLTCQVKSGIFLLLPEMASSDKLGEYILNTVTVENSQQMCRNFSEYSDLINCTLSVQRECSQDSLKPTVPDTQSVLKGFQQLCKHINGFDAECVFNMTESACRGRKRRSVSDQTILKHLCEDTIDHNKCLVDSVKNCGDVTSSQYGDILSTQRPEMCLGIENTNGAFKPAVSAFILILTILLLH